MEPANQPGSAGLRVVHVAASSLAVTRLAAALAAAVLVVAGCGGEEQEGPRVAWAGEPRVAVHPDLPDDRLLTAQIRNDGEGELRLDAADARLLDERGEEVRATVRFSAGYSHSLYPPRDAPAETPRQESERLGGAATIPADGTAPLTVAWRAPRGTPRPATLDLGPASLSLPDAR
jgi:hypothetical protein